MGTNLARVDGTDNYETRDGRSDSRGEGQG
jgi:hypothetical protein